MSERDEVQKKVDLVPYNGAWPQLFEEAASEIAGILRGNCLGIHHIGSTSIPGIYAKPIIDILVCVQDLHAVDALDSKFEECGYACMGEYGIVGRRYYWKSKVHRSHHIHLFAANSPQVLRHLKFRDFMRSHDEYARAYSIIKRELAAEFPDDIGAYVQGKNSFIEMILYRTNTAHADQLTANDGIAIVPYDARWPKLARAEIRAIRSMTSGLGYELIEHLGSTAVDGLMAKPILDIFISLRNIKDGAQWIKPLEALGYVFWAENPEHTHLRFFKGMPPYGSRRTHHIHILQADDPDLARRIAFRDILRRNAQARSSYTELKSQLSKEYADDREEYTNSKGAFISKLLREHGID